MYYVMLVLRLIEGNVAHNIDHCLTWTCSEFRARWSRNLRVCASFCVIHTLLIDTEMLNFCDGFIPRFKFEGELESEP